MTTPDRPNAEEAARLREGLSAAVSIAEQMGGANEFGGLHIVVSDGNTDEESVQWCIDQTDKPLAVEERALAEEMLFWGDEITAFAYWLTMNNSTGALAAILEREQR